MREKAFLEGYEGSNLTKHQLLIWVGQNLEPEVPIYNMTHTFSIPTSISPKAFQAAFQAVVNSSDALRTVIEEVDGVPNQRPLEAFTYEASYLDFTAEPSPEDAARAWVKLHSAIPFVLAEKLFDSALLKIRADKFIWYLKIHHIIADAWSHSLVFRHVSNLYESYLKEGESTTLELPLFQAYLSQERSYRQSDQYVEADEFWRQELAEAAEPITFFGHQPIKQTTHVQRIPFYLGVERTRRLKEIALREGLFTKSLNITLFNMFVAVLCTYLHRVSGNCRFSLGIPLHNRHTPMFKETIGLFMQVLPLRVSIDEEETFESLIRKVGSKAAELQHHRQYTVGNPMQNKAFDIIVNYHNASYQTFHGAPVTTEWLHSGHEHDSLAVQIHDFGLSGNIVIDFDFHCDVFSEPQRKQSIDHFLQVLDVFIEDSTQAVRGADFLSSEEEHYLLVELNRTERAFPINQTFAELFTAQAARTPERVAASFENRSLSYSQLNLKANQLARHLQSMGVGPEVCVGIYMERNLEMLVGIVAILKAGGAYVPLDPDHPAERLRFILDDAGISILLTQDSLVADLRDQKQRAICLDSDWDAICKTRETTRGPSSVPDSLAYVIYTSGSTGVSKGVMVEQKGMLNHLFAKICDLDLTQSDIVAQTASPCFDISVWQFLVPLLIGGKVEIVSAEVVRDAALLLQSTTRAGVTILELVPTALRAMLDELEVSPQETQLAALRWLVVTGEALAPVLCLRWLAKFAGVPLLNAYGPTECSDDVTHYAVFEPPPDTALQTPIGRAVANLQIYLVDQLLRPVPIGVVGEICVGGIGVCRGYLNDPARTAESFVSDPFSKKRGGRLYKTGDLAIFLPDGNLEFIGRIDQQVKIHGFRIELGEIEAILLKHPLVREAVAEVSDHPRLGRRLVAYLVMTEDATLELGHLRSFLREKLPEYMVPAAFVLLEALPLTANGKTNRKALPEPDWSKQRLNGRFTAPRTPTEKRLIELWKEVLNVERVGIQDSFFEMGGHSLLASRLASELRKTFGIEFPLRLLFETPTVEEVAKYIDSCASL